MKRKPTCSILSFDYLDFDVFLNIHVFYRMAGYRISLLPDIAFSDLVVVLRGIPSHPYLGYLNTVHIYDYVREHQYNPLDFFPNASKVFFISLHSPDKSHHNLKHISAYLPVFSSIWRASTLPPKSHLPLHLSNFKPMNQDPYQEQLLHLISSKQIRVFGSKWDRRNIHSRPLSYFSSNNLLAGSSSCYGLMYPYQRGTSLSGRMWQAPINGCYVISELGTNIYNCPGVLEVSSYNLSFLIPDTNASQLSRDAISFWNRKTNNLASDLHLDLRIGNIDLEIFYARILLLRQHIHFQYTYFVLQPLGLLCLRSKSSIRKFFFWLR